MHNQKLSILYKDANGGIAFSFINLKSLSREYFATLNSFILKVNNEFDENYLFSYIGSFQLTFIYILITANIIRTFEMNPITIFFFLLTVILLFLLLYVFPYNSLIVINEDTGKIAKLEYYFNSKKDRYKDFNQFFFGKPAKLLSYNYIYIDGAKHYFTKDISFPPNLKSKYLGLAERYPSKTGL